MNQATLKRRVLHDVEEADRIILDHLNLVHRLAWYVHGRVSSAVEREELIQIGMVALVEAAHAFEDRGYAFSTYASLRIKGAMIDHLRRGTGQSRGAATARRAIQSARSAVESFVPGPASAVEIARHMGLTLSEYHHRVDEASGAAHEALDDVYSDADMAFSDVAERADDVIARCGDQQRLRDALLTLDARSQLVLQLYFFEELNLEEIGRVLAVGPARVCQIKSAALNKLRQDPRLAALI